MIHEGAHLVYRSTNTAQLQNDEPRGSMIGGEDLTFSIVLAKLFDQRCFLCTSSNMNDA